MLTLCATLNNSAQRRQDYGHPTYAADVDLRTAFIHYSADHCFGYCSPGSAFQTRYGSVQRLCQLCQSETAWLGTGIKEVSFGLHSFSDLDFDHDAALLTELFELLVPAVETMASEAASLKVKLNWQKTKVLSFGQQGGWAIDNHSSRAGGCSSWRSWLPHSLNNSKLSWYLMSVLLRVSCGYAKPRQQDLQVTVSIKLSCTILAFYPFSCIAPSAGQSPK